MDEYQHTVLTRGRYRLMALTHETQYDPAGVIGYTVVTDSGARLTPDLSMDDARVWMDALVEAENGGRAIAAPDAADLRAGKRR